MGCYIWYSEEKTGRGRSPPRPVLVVPNVTAHPYIHIDYSLFLFWFMCLLYKLHFVSFIINEHDKNDDDDDQRQSTISLYCCITVRFVVLQFSSAR